MRIRQRKLVSAIAAALILGPLSVAHAGVAIPVDPDGLGPLPAAMTVTLDWQPGNMLVPGGIGNLAVGQTVRALLQARLAILLDANGAPLPFPADKEWTYVASVPLKVQSVLTGGGNTFVTWEFDTNDANSAGYTNFVEIWKDDVRNANDLAGTGFNDGTLILTGIVTDVSQVMTVFSSQQLLDQFQGDSLSGQVTRVINGSQSITVNVTWPDPDYFPGFTSDKIDTIFSKFNSSNLTPYQQVEPSAKFVGDSAGFPPIEPGPAPSVFPNIGTVNALSGPDVQAQADPNQSFEFSEQPPVGACRVTYGGNDRNGNIDPRKFGEACSPDTTVAVAKVKGKVAPAENCYTFGGQVGAPSATSAKGGPFGEHTHHQKSGPAGDFIFRAGSRSAPKATRIDAVVCKDEGACRQAVANGQFKQIDFEGTGSFRTLDATAKAYLIANGAPADIGPDNVSDRKYYFRVDMDDLGEPGNQWASGKKSVVNDLIGRCQSFFSADQNNPLSTTDPTFLSYFNGYTSAQACSSCPDVYQLRIYSGDSAENPGSLIYETRGYLTGGNIQIHRLIR